MSTFHLCHLGRAGNSLVAYLFARGYCERYGLTLTTDPWDAEKVFCIDHPRGDSNLPRRDENTLRDGEGDVSYRSYSQRARCAEFYTKSQVKEWLKFRPEVETALSKIVPGEQVVAAHLRRGDYVGANSPYPLVSKMSYIKACDEFGIDLGRLFWIQEECPCVLTDYHASLSWVPDFFVMAKSRTLLRANSSFSFVAAILVEANGGAVYSPVIDGLKGGVEHACDFVPGNWPRLADFSFVDELQIRP